MNISNDAIIFYLAFFNTAKGSLKFKVEDEKMPITKRGRAALDELVIMDAVECVALTEKHEQYKRGKTFLLQHINETARPDILSWCEEHDFKAFGE